MADIFLKIVNMSISATWIVLAVLLLRLILKRAPKWIAVLLWGIVAVRLICPFSIESVLSLIPSAETISPGIMMDRTPEINTGISIINNTVNPIISSSFSPNPAASANPLQILIPIISVIWIAGIVIMLAYTVISYLCLKRKIRTAVLLRENIYQSERVTSPFVFGVIRPKIYLPFNVTEQDMQQVIAHEQAHIRRKDHWWKPFGFLLLTVYWFNPLLWLGYVLLCRDIELACDEKVVKQMNTEQRADYSQALLTCSVNRRTIAACPLAFGEVGVKTRVKSVLNYRKPAFWLIIFAVVISIAAAVCFLTNPASAKLKEDDLKAKFPNYFHLSSMKGLEIYMWKTPEGSYSCGLLPGTNRHHTKEEMSKLLDSPATIEEMRAIIDCYISDGRLSKDMVSVVPFDMLDILESVFYDNEFNQELNQIFWSGTPTPVDSQYAGYIDYAVFDIDGDGKDEFCSLGYGPTSGLFTFTFSVSENGVLEYFNVFLCSYSKLGFEKNEEGQMMLVGKDGDYTRYMSLHVDNGNIVITCDEQDISYWGKQGLSSPFAPKSE